MGPWLEAYNKTMTFIFRVWDTLSDRPRQKLQDTIDRLEVESRVHQLNGDLEQMRRTRGQLEEARRRLAIRDDE